MKTKKIKTNFSLMNLDVYVLPQTLCCRFKHIYNKKQICWIKWEKITSPQWRPRPRQQERRLKSEFSLFQSL